MQWLFTTANVAGLQRFISLSFVINRNPWTHVIWNVRMASYSGSVTILIKICFVHELNRLFYTLITSWKESEHGYRWFHADVIHELVQELLFVCMLVLECFLRGV